MKEFSSDRVIDLWKKEYSSKLNKPTKYNPSQQFHQIANMCAPGKFFYYILNINNISLDFIHPNVEYVLGIKPEDASIGCLLKSTLPKELEIIIKKEKIISEFISTFSDHNDLLNYKIVYTYKCKGVKGKIQTMMIQTTPLTLSETCKIEHLFVIHSDISHLGNVSTDWISFRSLNGKKSYLKIKAHHGRFDPKLANLDKPSCIFDLTKRELEILKLMSQGLNAKAISEKLHISFNTTRTHRQNILSKANASNTAELIAKCLSEGIL
ncbi:LuxR C-terminal-related transcriptional regulator [Cyclobacterium sp. 1_MG-2023]|uniref:response regulator transcription factor n=1 Tax=Cyclobacterium sp. 1_MG-2023 TaxID=3062681 RepID=UPI0026E28646|nr:LuxR C-terminal-related transcriptional regulator [Cyclobacterium sp. 1_MG-2023]MDO6435935.1 LuxR C-terminal-related transcriptional regulator [Cyclobacterium sp. 1_MG-2023]